MFHDLNKALLNRMDFLEKIDAQDRIDGTARSKRLRQIPPETGRFLAILAAFCPDGDMIEIGTSAGYSTLWLIRACQARNRKIKTFEILPEKVRMAKETFRLADVQSYVELIEGDGRDYIAEMDQIAFCFLDAEKEIYEECYELTIPRMVPGGIFIADNAINHRESLNKMLSKALLDKRIDCTIVPVGKGVLLGRKN